MEHEHEVIEHHALAEPVGQSFGKAPAQDQGTCLKIVVGYGFISIKDAVPDAFLVTRAILVNVLWGGIGLVVTHFEYLHLMGADSEIRMRFQKRYLFLQFLRVCPVVVAFAEGYIFASNERAAIHEIFSKLRIARL